MSKPKKLTVKILLDVCMFLVLVLLYKAKVLTLTFHEVAGLAILLVFLVHCLLNRKWIAGVTKKLFGASTPTRTKVSYWLAVGLVVSFLLIAVSGVMFSKVLFKQAFADAGIEPNTSFWRTVHVFFSAVSLILVGAHVGLYWDTVKSFFRKHLAVPQKVAKPLCYTLLAALLAWGVYAIPTSGFAKWIASPVIPMSHDHGQQGGESTDQEQTAEQAGDARDEAEDDSAREGTYRGHDEADADAQAQDEAASDQTEGRHGNREDGAGSQDRENSGYREHGGSSGETDAQDDTAADVSTEQAARDDQDTADASASQQDASYHGDKGSQEDGADRNGTADNSDTTSESERSGSHHNQPITAASVLTVVANFSGIIALFATITYAIDARIKGKKKAAKAGREG